MRELLVLATTLLCAPLSSAQRPAQSRSDSATAANLENRIAVATSGVWNVDGEFKQTDGAYYKLVGYFAWVASTSWSADNGEQAVASFNLQPMAGGASYWLGARFLCRYVKADTVVRCVPMEGANVLLNLNIDFKLFPQRGQRAEATISEPEDKSGEKRFDSVDRSTPRGKFSLTLP
jgi:hypothetical protein